MEMNQRIHFSYQISPENAEKEENSYFGHAGRLKVIVTMLKMLENHV